LKRRKNDKEAGNGSSLKKTYACLFEGVSNPDELAFVGNTTTGVSTILKSLGGDLGYQV